MSELKRAVGKMYETQEHATRVQEAFTKGQRPPLMLSLDEKAQIKVMLQRVEARKKSPARTATFSVKSKFNINNLASNLNR